MQPRWMVVFRGRHSWTPRVTKSLSGLLLVVALSAVALYFLRWHVIRGGSAGRVRGDSLLYEGAQPSEGLTVRVGSSILSVGAVVRNDRDGSIRAEDGRGNAVSTSSSNSDTFLSSQASWLDMANIVLRADTSSFEVIELRVFDHNTRTLLTGIGDKKLGFAMSTPKVIQLWGQGDRLPESIDVWFRVNRHASGEPVVELRGGVGAKAAFAKGSLSVREIRPGTQNFSRKPVTSEGRPEFLWHPASDGIDSSCTVVFDWDGDWIDGRYEICAVGTDGRKTFPDIPHFIDFRTKRSTEVITFNTIHSEVSHFELRPHRGRHTFYFDDVRLPTVSNRPFLHAPIARVAVDGEEIMKKLSEYDPIGVSLRLRRGGWSTASSLGLVPSVKSIEQVDNLTTAFLEVNSMPQRGWVLYYFDRGGQPLVGWRSLETHTNASQSHGLIESWSFPIPLERIGSVEIHPPGVP